jgi:hypothetical protein
LRTVRLNPLTGAVDLVARNADGVTGKIPGHAAGARGDGGASRTPQKSDDAGHGRADLR